MRYLISAFIVLLATATCACSASFSETPESRDEIGGSEYSVQHAPSVRVSGYYACAALETNTQDRQDRQDVPDRQDRQDSGGETFLVCGTGGRIDIISADGSMEHVSTATDADLIGILVQEHITLIVGSGGTILYSMDGKNFVQASKATDADILGVTSFNDAFYACTVNGSILSSNDGISWSVMDKLTGSAIVAIDASSEYMMGISADTDIYILDTDGIWSVENFNRYYDGYYEKYVFSSIKNIGQALYILGHVADEPGIPHIMFSDNGGEVWFFRSLSEINKKPPEEFYPITISAVDAYEDQLFASCNGGRLLTIADCSVCNTIEGVLDADIFAFALGANSMLVAGSDFKCSIIEYPDAE